MEDTSFRRILVFFIFLSDFGALKTARGRRKTVFSVLSTALTADRQTVDQNPDKELRVLTIRRNPNRSATECHAS